MTTKILETAQDFDSAPAYTIVTWGYVKNPTQFTEVAIKNWEGEWETTCPYNDMHKRAPATGEAALELYGRAQVLRWGLE